MRKHAANIVTSLNLAAGCVGIILASDGLIGLAYLMVLFAALFDFADGFVARALGTTSEFGKILDSLADFLSFGILPSMMLYKVMQQLITYSSPIWGIEHGSLWAILLAGSSFFIAIFSALRLAKFHVDTRQTSSFRGLATPANALLIASTLNFAFYSPEVPALLYDIRFYLLLIVISSFLMISEIPMFSLKIKSYSLKDNIDRYIFLFVSIIILSFAGKNAVPLIIAFYIVLNITLAGIAAVKGKK